MLRFKDGRQLEREGVWYRGVAGVGGSRVTPARPSTVVLPDEPIRPVLPVPRVDRIGWKTTGEVRYQQEEAFLS